MKNKMPFDEAFAIANRIVEILQPGCQRIEIAGSVRRKKPEVGDIEIVCVPVILEEAGVWTVSRLDALLPQVKGARLKNGELYKQILLPEEICLDLYITTLAQWGVIFTLRTGSAEFSRRLVTIRQKGGLLPSYLRVREGRVWAGEHALETPEEVDVFKALNLQWIAPEKRV